MCTQIITFFFSPYLSLLLRQPIYDQMTFAVRLAFLDRVEEQLRGLSASRAQFTRLVPSTPAHREESDRLRRIRERLLNESDISMIRLAIKQTARAAVKEKHRDALTTEALAGVHARLTRLEQEVAALQTPLDQREERGALPDLATAREDPKSKFDLFDLLAGLQATNRVGPGGSVKLF